MIYLDNSATTAFKPPEVKNAAVAAMEYLSANAGRSGHRKSVAAAMQVYRTRLKIADFVGCDGNVVFTLNCTEALNLALLGSTVRGGHVVTTVYEHNSVLRPLYESERTSGIGISVAKPDRDGRIGFEQIRPLLRNNTYLVAVNHVSNVTGAVTDIEGIARGLKGSKIRLLVDGAQSVGYRSLDMKKTGIDFLAIAPHKGLHSIQGLGVLCMSAGASLMPIKFGGTGTQSLSVLQPHDAPECFESGTLPLVAIAAANRAVDFTSKHFGEHREKIAFLSEKLLRGLAETENVRLMSDMDTHGIAAFNIGALSSESVCDILDREYSIAARGGLHCAPLVHKHFSTIKSGAVRLSLGFDNTESEIDETLRAVREIAKRENKIR